jgi:hypothetical protein
MSKKSRTVAVAEKPALLTAAQIDRNCPVHVEGWGKQAAAHYDKAVQYEGKADDHWNSLGQYLAKAKAACDGGGFAAFREKFCPHLGKTRINELLRIGSGDKTPPKRRRVRHANVYGNPAPRTKLPRRPLP